MILILWSYLSRLVHGLPIHPEPRVVQFLGLGGLLVGQAEVKKAWSLANSIISLHVWQINDPFIREDCLSKGLSDL